jgi:hypothetical protein
MLRHTVLALALIAVLLSAQQADANFNVTFKTGAGTKADPFVTKTVNDNNSPAGGISDTNGTSGVIEFTSAKVGSWTIAGITGTNGGKFKAFIDTTSPTFEVQIEFAKITHSGSNKDPLIITASYDNFSPSGPAGTVYFATSEQSTVTGAGSRTHGHTYNPDGDADDYGSVADAFPDNDDMSAITNGSAPVTHAFTLTARITFNTNSTGGFGTGTINDAGGVATQATFTPVPTPGAFALLASAVPAGLFFLRRRKAA